MFVPLDVNVFPEEHRLNLKDILYNLADIDRQHKEAHTKWIMSHRTKNSKIIDENSFMATEFYRLRIDAANLYLKYLTDNDLMKYVAENG